ncbi:MAG: hypothetical protein KIS30_05740 [Thermoplasmata archaeon]|nr:hypothetical protein [Candidatus Sysuiplasma acidicola]MBX8646242.1 hypothetical protein [Candidatus Sysuiplasma acidicola]MDH2905046.1 hypothetical protein [Methanomassiliicoccales archaeon]
MGREDEIKKKIEHFGGLLDEHTAALLVDYENSQLGEEKRQKLKSKLERATNSHSEALVLEIQNGRNYRKRDGTEGTVLSIKIFVDGTEAWLTFWDKQVEKIRFDRLQEGEHIILTNCQKSAGKYGLQYTTGKGGVVRTKKNETIFE